MKTFKDNANRTWTVELNIGAVKRVRDLLSVDLLQLGEKNVLDRLAGDPVLLCDVIYVVCKPQADEQKISDEDFGRAMGGDAIDHASNALLEELVDFFPQSRRPVMKKTLAELRKIETMAVEAVKKRLDSGLIERRMKAALKKDDEEFKKTLGKLSSSSPDRPASTPTQKP